MADMDSPGARNRQAPATVKRNTAPAKPARSKVVTVKPSRPKRSSGSSSRSQAIARRASSSSSRRSGGTRRTSTRSSSSSQRRSTPTPPPKPTEKVIKPPAPPKPPGNATWLRSDSTYQRQLAAYNKALADFQAEQGLSRTDYETNYQNTRRDIGLAKEDALEALENDYAARGLLRSSLYNTDLGELNQQYQNQYTDLDKQRTAFLDSLTQGLVGFKNEQSIQQQNAMSEALRRKAEKYNL